MSETYREIRNQPRSWDQTLSATAEQWSHIASSLALAPRTHFLFVGCGTSLYIAQSAAQSFQEVTGHVATAVPGSEVFLSPASTVPRHPPVVAVAISRSGATSEVLLAVDYLRQHCANVRVIGLTCTPGAALAAKAHATIELPHATEQSVVMTQSYTNMLLALQVVAGAIAQDTPFLGELSRLPGVLGATLDTHEAFAKRLGDNLAHTRFLYLGLGPASGLAQEGTLKLKEMTQTPCEAYNPLEFRHGPISTVGAGTAVVLLEGLRERAYMAAIESDVKRFGAYVAVLAPYQAANADLALGLPEDLSDIARGVLYLPALQFLAYHRALALGLNPDRPRNLRQVVLLDAV